MYHHRNQMLAKLYELMKQENVLIGIIITLATRLKTDEKDQKLHNADLTNSQDETCWISLPLPPYSLHYTLLLFRWVYRSKGVCGLWYNITFIFYIMSSRDTEKYKEHSYQSASDIDVGDSTNSQKCVSLLERN